MRLRSGSDARLHKSTQSENVTGELPTGGIGRA